MNFCEKTPVSLNVYAGFRDLLETPIFAIPQNSFFVIAQMPPKSATAQSHTPPARKSDRIS
jgi:hypothetical protein